MIGKVVIVDQGPGGAGQYICLRRNGSQLTVVPSSSATSYKPIFIPEAWVVGAMDIPDVLADVMFGLSKLLSSANVNLTRDYRIQAQQTLGMMRAAFLEVNPCRWPNFAGRAVEAMGRNNSYEVLIVLEDNGQSMSVATEKGQVVHIDKRGWVYGQVFDGESRLINLCRQHPNNQLLKGCLQYLMRHQN